MAVVRAKEAHGGVWTNKNEVPFYSWRAVALLLALVIQGVAAQFPGDRLPIEEVSLADIFRACEMPISSEGDAAEEAPGSLLGVGVSGRWAYERTNKGVLKNPSLLSDTGKIDLWISNDTVGSNLGLLHDISAVFYITGEAAKNDALEATVMVHARGHYVPSKGLLCLLGCQEALLPSMYFKSNPNANISASAGDDMMDQPEPADDSENVEAGVANPIPISQQMETQCRTRIVLRFKGQTDNNAKAVVTGRLESLRQPGEAPFFSSILISANSGAISSQVAWFKLEMLFESLICTFQAAFVLLQIAHTRKEAAASFVSLTMISVQIFVYAFYFIRSIYYPLRYLNSDVLLYFISDVANVPRFVEFAVFVLYVILAIMVDSKRGRRTKPRKDSEQGLANDADVEGASLLTSGAPSGSPKLQAPSERQFALFFWAIYTIIALCMWFSFDFDTFLRGSTFLFLLPQVCLNYIWNPPQAAMGAVTYSFAIGNTLAQMVWLAYEVLRPTIMGYDAFFAFPHAWYWSSMVLMILQLAAFIAQRLRGGRFSRPAVQPDIAPRTEMTLTSMVQP